MLSKKINSAAHPGLVDSSTIYLKGRGEVGIISGIWLGWAGEGLECLLSIGILSGEGMGSRLS